ncbi:hypothetical protein OR1_00274 [Geobacter sp. OR-1]|uniref:hypothetical protein n=1 Tax=Geobacter sp. OR-1 TaxID=1266765 RepID=UPI0005439EAE|nr:hypothetical protein [Geobacter sp. OR-1]GAM08004.1 hypothetical protein OR1_00274 [Geobacter sp. OR-1]
MKKQIVVVLAIVALAAFGCSKKQEAPKAEAPAAAPAGQAAPGAAQGGNPHAGIQKIEIPAGAGHKGKVTETMNSGGYTYALVEENGQKLWVAVMETKVAKGDVVEFPDSPPMVNFQSKTLNRTFDKIIFAPGLRIAGK